MTVAATRTKPSLEDARRAAEALAQAGAKQVLLFGSLARGAQDADSDIDLVAIFDDLDYVSRHARILELKRAAAKASGRAVDLHVTDRPEWVLRSQRLATTFERRIAAETLVLIDEPAGEVHWDKDIGLPDTDEGEAAKSLFNSVQALGGLNSLLQPASHESGALKDRDPDTYLWAVAGRLRGVCSQSQTIMETALKAFVHLYGDKPPPRTHDLDELLGMLPQPMRSVAAEQLDRFTLETVSEWRKKGTYVADFPDVPLPELVPLGLGLATTACHLVRLAADHLDQADKPTDDTRRTTKEIRRQTALIKQTLDRWDLTRETPTAQLDIPEPPEPVTRVAD